MRKILLTCTAIFGFIVMGCESYSENPDIMFTNKLDGTTVVSIVYAQASGHDLVYGESTPYMKCGTGTFTAAWQVRSGDASVLVSGLAQFDHTTDYGKKYEMYLDSSGWHLVEQ